ncbi:MAG: DNA methyltransferase [Thermodesulfobacteriota bacterium]
MKIPDFINEIEAKGVEISMVNGVVKWLDHHHAITAIERRFLRLNLPKIIDFLETRAAQKQLGPEEYIASIRNTVVNADNMDILTRLPAESVDAIISDLPYGYNLLGKSWDKPVSSETLGECLRILKPGGWGIFFSAPRQDVHLTVMQNIKEAGFEMQFSPIYWTYPSGFTKAADMSARIDKRLGVARKVIGIKIRKPDFNVSGSSIFGFMVDSKKSYIMKDLPLTAPESEKAKEMAGSFAGFQPKPAVEVILVVRKPLSEKSCTDQALKDGKGVTWMDDCRIPFVNEKRPERDLVKQRSSSGGQVPASLGKSWGGSEKGRFPANLLVSDDVLDTHKKRYSRFFSLDAWAAYRFPFLIQPKPGTKEKGLGLKPVPGRKVSSGRGKPLGRQFQRKEPIRKNTVPCVKPVDLMAYLVTMFSRPGDLIADPFAGSGTTCIAAKLLGRDFIGIEQSEEYHAIAEARLNQAHQDEPYFRKFAGAVEPVENADEAIGVSLEMERAQEPQAEFYTNMPKIADDADEDAA